MSCFIEIIDIIYLFFNLRYDIDQGCPNFFPLEHDLKLLEHRGLKAKASLRRRWGFGGSPPGNFWKIASKLYILVYLRAVIAIFKTEKLYEKICVSLRKDFILDKINYLDFFFKFTLNRRIFIIVTLHLYFNYIMFHVYKSQMLIYQTFSFQNLLLSLNFSLIILTIARLLQNLIYNFKFLNFCNISVHCILIFYFKE